MQRRVFLTLAAAGVVSLMTACSALGEPPRSSAGLVDLSTTSPTPRPTFTRFPAPTPSLTRAPVPTPTQTPTNPATPSLDRVALPEGALTELPGAGNLLAWTVDDGSNSEVIRRYAEFARDTGTRLTFFVNGTYEGWTENADLLRPLVASGRIQLANHTFDHVDLTEASDDEVIRQLQENHDFLLDTFGVDARPYFRPPYGFHDHRTDHLAASIGYTTPVLWYGSLSDSGPITTEQLLGFAETWFLPQHIVIGHLNFTPVTEVFPELLAIIRNRGLQTVTLDDVFVKP